RFSGAKGAEIQGVLRGARSVHDLPVDRHVDVNVGGGYGVAGSRRCKEYAVVDGKRAAAVLDGDQVVAVAGPDGAVHDEVRVVVDDDRRGLRWVEEGHVVKVEDVVAHGGSRHLRP